MAVRQRPPDGSDGMDSWASTPAIRRTMVGNRRRDTAPELLIRRLLHAQGLRYRVDWPLPFDRRRRADIVFIRQKVAVFVDGCFWHGCPEHYVAPLANGAYWADKLTGNLARDRDTDRRLGELGWTVIRVWEHQDALSACSLIAASVASTRPPTTEPAPRRAPPPQSTAGCVD